MILQEIYSIKDNLPDMGIYQIKNVLDDKVYIGSSNNLEKRLKTHLRFLKSESHNNKHLQSAWTLYGGDNFIYSILEVIDNESLLISREQFHIDRYRINDSFCIDDNLCYNISVFADRPNPQSYSEEQRMAISERMTGEKNHFFGKKHTEESKDRIKKNHADFKGEKGPFFGRKHTEEAKRKNAESKIGKYDGAKNPASKIYYLDLVNEKTGEIIKGPIECAALLCDKHNIDRSHIHQLLNGNRRVCRGWTILKEDKNE